MLAIMERLARSYEEFREDITDWQRNLDMNLDPRKTKRAIDRATQVQSGGIR